MHQQQATDINKKTRSHREVREKRFDDLIASCQDQVLQQIIGPFGLSPAMFHDQDGGNVTTQHNAGKDIYAKKEEEYCRNDYDYSTAKSQIKKDHVHSGNMNSNEFTDTYSGKKEPTKRMNSNGKLVMNAELDHTIPLKELHQHGSWMQGKDKRKELSSEKHNLHYTSHKNNRAKSDKNADEFLSESNGFDSNITKPIIDKAKDATSQHQPSNTERVKYHSKELAHSGGKEALKNGIRQAFGMALYEFVNGSFVEVNRLIKEPSLKENFIDHLIQAIKNVAGRIQAKLTKILEAFISGGVQGFVSNFMTFLINTIWTTAAKVVTIIREGMKGLWKAIKLMANPPQGMSGIDIAREVTKIIAGVISVSLGMALEESVKAFIISLPILVPFADSIAAAITAILTGITTALVVYGIDRLFDWLNADGTEMIEAQLESLEASIAAFRQMGDMLDAQFRNSAHYQLCIKQYEQVQSSLSMSALSLDMTIHHAEVSISTKTEIVKVLETKFPELMKMDQELDDLLNKHQLLN